MADQQATKEAPKGAAEPVKNCAGCNKPMKKAKRYYRNGKYYCNQKCCKKTNKAAATEEAPAEKKAQPLFMTSAQERRRHPRLTKNIPLKLCGEQFDVVTETHNLSCSGVYCRVNKYFDPMTRFEIHLLLPFKKGAKVITKKVSCHGVVVRVESEPGNKFFNIAVFFNEIDKKNVLLITQYINSNLPQKQNE